MAVAPALFRQRESLASALAAKEMGGSFSAQSDGIGRGATFTLELAAHPPNQVVAPASSSHHVQSPAARSADSRELPGQPPQS
jgi:hypothetical protein